MQPFQTVELCPSKRVFVHSHGQKPSLSFACTPVWNRFRFELLILFGLGQKVERWWVPEFFSSSPKTYSMSAFWKRQHHFPPMWIEQNQVHTETMLCQNQGCFCKKLTWPLWVQTLWQSFKNKYCFFSHDPAFWADCVFFSHPLHVICCPRAFLTTLHSKHALNTKLFAASLFS